MSHLTPAWRAAMVLLAASAFLSVLALAMAPAAWAGLLSGAAIRAALAYWLASGRRIAAWAAFLAMLALLSVAAGIAGGASGASAILLALTLAADLGAIAALLAILWTRRMA